MEFDFDKVIKAGDHHPRRVSLAKKSMDWWYGIKDEKVKRQLLQKYYTKQLIPDDDADMGFAYLLCREKIELYLQYKDRIR